MRLMIVFLVLISFNLFGCKPKADSAVKGIALQVTPSDGSKNIAVIIGAEGAGKNYLKGVAVDVSAYSDAFSQPGLGFSVRVFTEPSPGKDKAKTTRTYKELQAEIGRAANDVGQAGTLVIAFSGHGQEGTGSWYYEDKARTFQELFAPILDVVKSRNGIRIARGMIISDSCFSGNLLGTTSSVPQQKPVPNIQGTVLRSSDTCWKTSCANVSENANAAIMRDQIIAAIGKTPSTRSSAVQNFSSMFTESVVIAASAPDLEAIDDGQNGGLFSGTLLNELKQAKTEAPLVTMRKLLNATIKQIQDRKDMKETLPSYAAFPESVLDDYVFRPGQDRYDIGATELYVPQSADGICDQSYVVPWAEGFGKDDKGRCLNPIAFCQCAAYSSGCAIYPTGASSQPGMEPILYRRQLIDENGGCNKSCDVLVQANWNMFLRNCSGRTRMFRGRDEEGTKRLEFFQYAWSENDGGPIRVSQYPSDPNGPVPQQIRVGKK